MKINVSHEEEKVSGKEKGQRPISHASHQAELSRASSGDVNCSLRRGLSSRILKIPRRNSDPLRELQHN